MGLYSINSVNFRALKKTVIVKEMLESKCERGNLEQVIEDLGMLILEVRESKVCAFIFRADKGAGPRGA